jgi:hypothetical protein
MILSPADKRMGEAPALWFRNADMVVEGSNEPFPAACPLTGKQHRLGAIPP